MLSPQVSAYFSFNIGTPDSFELQIIFREVIQVLTCSYVGGGGLEGTGRRGGEADG